MSGTPIQIASAETRRGHLARWWPRSDFDASPDRDEIFLLRLRKTLPKAKRGLAHGRVYRQHCSHRNRRKLGLLRLWS